MSYPKRADLFKKWSDAMLRGATVDKPTYSKKSNKGGKAPARRAGTHPRRMRRKRRNRRKED